MPKKNQWLNSQRNDPFYKRAKKEHFRARSAFKLLEIQQKYPLFQVGYKFPAKILDLGCAPGSWIEVILHVLHQKLPNASPQTLKKIHIAGIDVTSIKNFDTPVQIDFLRKDVFTPEANRFIHEHAPLHLILSDMAPKTAGDFRDIAIQEAMVERVFEFVSKFLVKNGNVLIKLFESEKTPIFVRTWRPQFRLLKLIKPKASRPKSREVYLVGIGYKKQKR